MKTRTSLSVCLLLAALLSGGGCQTTRPGQRTAIGALLGAAAGAAAGAAIDDQKRGRGALVGALGGAVVGGSIGYALDRAAQRAARENRQVVTKGNNPGERIVATPIRQEGDYRIVEVKYLDKSGNVVRKEIKRVPIG